MSRSTSARPTPATTCRKLEAQVEKRLAVTTARPPIVSLAATMALEHFTAILAHQLLANPRHLAGAEPETRRRCGAGTRSRRSSTRASPTTPGCHATRDWPRWKRWKVKAKVMLFVTRNFVVDRTAGALELMRQDGITGLRAWARLLWYRVGAAGHVPQDRRRLGQVLPARLPPVERGRPRAARARYDRSGESARQPFARRGAKTALRFGQRRCLGAPGPPRATPTTASARQLQPHQPRRHFGRRARS